MSDEFAGSLRAQLTPLVRAAGRDDLGGAIGGWTVGATIWAAVRPDGAGPPGDADVPATAGRWRATVRAPTPLAAPDRVRWRGVTLRVRRVEADPATPDRVTWLLEDER